MTAVDQVLNVARGEIGYVEQGGHGNDGNVTKYWAELHPQYQGEPWCAAFASWVFKHAGATLPAMPYNWGFTYCPDAETWAQKNGRWLSSPRVGAVVIYEHPGEKVAGHTGIVESFDANGIVTIEGNTSPDEQGSQVNGGGVYRRHRPYKGGSLIILGYLWPPSLDGSDTGDDFMDPVLAKLLVDTEVAARKEQGEVLDTIAKTLTEIRDRLPAKA